MPASPMSSGTATTQPMAVPRTGVTSFKTGRIGATPRSTQRIVLPTPPGSRPESTKSLTMGTPGGRINLPIGMILRCLPPEVLAADLSEFEATGAAATEIGLPMNMILGQLPSGKVEMAFQDLIPHFPAGYLQPTESIASYLPNLISLPLMDVVMRIPPDLLALRPDQKDVDAAVINMADPFTEEILREQAETAQRQSQTNIIEESQVPQEEFVPRDQAGTAKPAGTTSLPAVPMPSAARIPTPPPMSSLRGSTGMPPVSSQSVRIQSASGQLPRPTRPQSQVTFQREASSSPELPAPVPPVPRHTGSIPAPPPPRHTTSLPVVRRTTSIPAPSQATASAPPAPAPAPAEKSAEAASTSAPDSEGLQRLAALAMAQMGESTESQAEVAPQPEPVRATEAQVEKNVPAPAVASTPAPASQPRSIPSPEPLVVSNATTSQTLPKPSPSAAAASSPAGPASHAAAPTASMAFNLNTCTAEDLVQNIPGCFQDLAASIIEYRTKIGSFKRLEDLLEVPGITKAAYTNLTGEAPPNNRIPLSLNELLGFPAEQHISLKDVTDRIACWPDVTGCVLSQSSGLSLVGTVPEGVDKAAIVAFVPRMFDSINKSFAEVSGQETDALVIPTSGTSFHLFRTRDLYLIILSRLPQMPERHVKVARFVLAALSVRKD